MTNCLAVSRQLMMSRPQYKIACGVIQICMARSQARWLIRNKVLWLFGEEFSRQSGMSVVSELRFRNSFNDIMSLGIDIFSFCHNHKIAIDTTLARLTSVSNYSESHIWDPFSPYHRIFEC